VAATSATLNGNLTALGTATTVNVSFEWGTATGSYTNTTDNQTKTATGAFSADLSGLTAAKAYYYRAKVVVGSGTPIYGAEKTLTTVDTTAPTITLVNASGKTKSGATITWTTNEAATTQVKYGLTAEYDSSSTEVTSLVTSHSVDLTGLKAGKTYHYQVISKDAANNQAVSEDATFKTTASSGGMPVWAWVIIGLAAGTRVAAQGYQSSNRVDISCPPCFHYEPKEAPTAALQSSQVEARYCAWISSRWRTHIKPNPDGSCSLPQEKHPWLVRRLLRGTVLAFGHERIRLLVLPPY
jgi:phosphodiesterase/alkaline phosphatase D-like protein